MAVLERSTLPNAITVGRILAAPAVFFLIMSAGFWPRLFSFVLFLVAAVSDIWDGYLARKYGWISDFGKLTDPIADKLLLVATFIPFYIISHGPGPGATLPVWGTLPLWVLIVVFGRELTITVMRIHAARRGRVVAAGKSGKLKAVFQNIFIGAALFWYALRARALALDWSGDLWNVWQLFHGGVLALSLAVAVFLTVYSLWRYLRAWNVLAGGAV